MLGHMKLHGGRINQLLILADDNHLVCASEDHSLGAWDMNTQKCRATWRLATPMRGVAACPDQVRRPHGRMGPPSHLHECHDPHVWTGPWRHGLSHEAPPRGVRGGVGTAEQPGSSHRLAVFVTDALICPPPYTITLDHPQSRPDRLQNW